MALDLFSTSLWHCMDDVYSTSAVADRGGGLRRNNVVFSLVLKSCFSCNGAIWCVGVCQTSLCVLYQLFGSHTRSLPCTPSEFSLWCILQWQYQEDMGAHSFPCFTPLSPGQATSGLCWFLQAKCSALTWILPTHYTNLETMVPFLVSL